MMPSKRKKDFKKGIFKIYIYIGTVPTGTVHFGQILIKNMFIVINCILVNIKQEYFAPFRWSKSGKFWQILTHLKDVGGQKIVFFLPGLKLPDYDKINYQT